MGRPIKIAESSTIDSQAYPSGFGGVAGEPFSSSGVYTINLQYDTDAGALVANGYIVNQKGTNKFLVGNSASIGSNLTTVTLANAAPANLTAGTASILCYNTSNVAFYAKRISSKHVWDWNDNKYIYKTRSVATANWANVATY